MKIKKKHTKNFSALRLNPLVFSRWSTNLPGVAMMMWGFLDNIRAWATMSIPPTITAHFTPILAPGWTKKQQISYVLVF